MAETRAKAERAFDDWLERYDDKSPRPPPAWLATATSCSRSTTSLPATNVIESAFATIRHRSSRAKGCVGSAMIDGTMREKS